MQEFKKFINIKQKETNQNQVNTAVYVTKAELKYELNQFKESILTNVQNMLVNMESNLTHKIRKISENLESTHLKQNENNLIDQSISKPNQK